VKTRHALGSLLLALLFLAYLLIRYGRLL